MNLNKSKGVSFATVAKTLPFKAYTQVLDNGNTVSSVTTDIGSFNQQLFSFDTHKRALDAFCDKLYMIDKISCAPFGYKPREDFKDYQNFITT